MKSAAALLMLVMSICGCADLGDPYTPPRIQPGIAIDGVKIGQSREQAWGLLGKPDAAGFYDGIRGGGQMESWTKGPHAGLWIFYSQWFDATGAQVGPIDLISVAPPFEGITEKQIGLNSQLRSVLQAYGEPSARAMDSTGTGVFTYCISGKYCYFSFRDSMTNYISMGYYVSPKPGEPMYLCP